MGKLDWSVDGWMDHCVGGWMNWWMARSQYNGCSVCAV